MAEGREILTARLEHQLGTLVSSVEIAARNNLGSRAVVAETTLAGLLNRVYGWELENANVKKQNCPGIDLIDEDRKIAVQVTATRTADKVRHTLEEVGRSGVIYKRLIVLVITNQQPTEAMRTCTVPAYTGSAEVWNIPDVFRAASALDAETLEGLTKYMASELGPVKERVRELRHLDLPPVSALPPTGFVGREAELREIADRFAQGDRMVVLTGLGGMGKTELAARYGQKHPGLTYFVRFDTDFDRTLLNMVHGIRPKLGELELKVDKAILRKKVLDILEQSSEEDLLIIDNADSPTGVLAELLKDEGFDVFKNLKLKLLLTTRSDADRPVKVRPMPEEPLFEIFRNHGAELTEAEMKDLIKAVNGHTLTINLIARTLNGKGWRKVTAQKMLTALREHNLRDQKYRKIATDYNQSTEQAQIYEHLIIVFDLSGMSDADKRVMCCACLLPEGGMDSELFGNSLEEEEQDALDSLLDRGWLEVKKDLLVIHPVIRLVCLTELNPTDADCEAFLDKMWARYDEKDYRPAHYSQMAELFTVAHDQLGKHHGRWLNRSGILYHVVGRPQMLHDVYCSRLLALEQTLPPNAIELATAYNHYGISLEDLGRYPAALTYSEKALAIRKAVLAENDPNLARSYNNVGSVYRQLGNYEKALEYQQKALSVISKAYPADPPDLATFYNNLGLVYDYLNDFQTGLEFHLKAQAIQERVLNIDHPDFASSYDNMGIAYCYLGNYRKSLEYLVKALTIRQKTLPEDHPSLAISYNNVGSTYGDLGDHRKALEYKQKALSILEKVFPADHPDLARACYNIAWTYHELRNLPAAAQYMRRAADIFIRSSLPKTHPDRVNYPKWADRFEKEAKMEQAIKVTMQNFGSTPPQFPFGKK